MGKKFAGKANVKTKKKPEKGSIILAAGVIVCILEISVNEEGELAMTMEAFEKQE